MSPGPNPRYLSADQVDDWLQMPNFAPEGHCQWCGKLRESKRCGRFCSGERREVYPGESRLRYAPSNCYIAWSAWAFSRPRFQRTVLIRDNFTCQQCIVAPRRANRRGLVMPDLSLLHVDHIVPLVKGGKTVMDNLQTLCRDCNLRKGGT